jgi:hypothetical protein
MTSGYFVRRLGGVLALLILLTPAAANAIYAPLPAITTNSGLLFSQSHAYDVHLRGNGEAIVNARITVTNTSDSDLKSLAYTADKASISEIAAYQQVTAKTCAPVPQPLGTSTEPAKPASDSGSAGPTVVAAPPVNTNCIDADPNTSTNYYYPYYSTSYSKATVALNGQAINITLPEVVSPNKQTTIVLAYAATGYVTHRWGALDYSYSTLKADTRIKDLTVAVSVDENYYLAGSKSKVNYRTPATATDLESNLKTNSGVANGANVDTSYVQNIGQNGAVIKNASQLAPHESFTVAGRYAASRWLLDVPVVLKWVVVLLILAGMYYLWYRVRRQKLAHRETYRQKFDVPEPQRDQQLPPAGVSAARPRVWRRQVPVQALPFSGVFRKIYAAFAGRRVRPFFFAFLCAALLFAVVGLCVLLTTYAYGSNGYSSSSASALVPWMLIAGYAAAGIALLTVAFGLPWLYGRVWGPKGVFKIILWQIVILSIEALVCGFIIAHSSGSSSGGCACYATPDCPSCAVPL